MYSFGQVSNFKVSVIRLLLPIIGLIYFDSSCAAPEAGNVQNSFVSVVMKRNTTELQYLGVNLGNEKVLAVYAPGWNQSEFTVTPASGSPQLIAVATQIGEDLSFLLLTVPGLSAGPAKFSRAPVVAGQIVYSPTDELAAGNVSLGSVASTGEHQPKKGVIFQKNKGPLLHFAIHNALIKAIHFGAPLFDDCGNVIAVSIADPRLAGSEQNQDPEVSVFALTIAQILSWLETTDVQVSLAEEECLGLEQQIVATQQELEEARRQAEESSVRVTEVEAQVTEARDAVSEAEARVAEAEEQRRIAESESEEQRAAAQQALDEAVETLESIRSEVGVLEQNLQDARGELEVAHALADLLQQELAKTREEEQRKRAEMIEKIKLYGGIVAGVLLLVLIFWWMNTRKKNRQLKVAHDQTKVAESKVKKVEAEHQQRLAPFECVLDGSDASGKRYLLKLHKEALGKPTGVIIGRNRRNADLIVENPQVGREHARLYISKRELYVKDLSSTNGTFVDGIKVEPQESVRLSDGSTLDLGTVRFRVQLNA